jgi:hypothetical protein
MDQPKLFSEDIYDALGDVVRALGGTKAVGKLLRGDAMPADEAGRWVKDCLNPNRRERFDPDQVLFLLKKGKGIGCHSAMHFLCDEAGYARPAPLDPKDELAQLQRQFIDAVHGVQAMGERLERLTRPPLQGVK